MKRKFIDAVSSSFLLWILKSVASGVVSGIAVFFTKQKLEKWKDNSSKEKEDANNEQ